MVNKTIKDKNIKICVVGLGYVGLPLLIEFCKLYDVVGFDLNHERIKQLKKGIDVTGNIPIRKLKKINNIKFSSSKKSVSASNIYIITVPTPIDKNNVPDLSPLKSASILVGKSLSKGDIVIYESTVYPGATEEVCIPLLAKESNLIFNKDFSCAYSPERINPGDKKHDLTSIIKIISASNQTTLDFIDKLYSSIIKAGTYKMSTIMAAEAAKVIENTQRDVNIALINELSIIFDKLDLDTIEVLNAAETKWNFLPFRPGLVGGHCIGVDPYYLTFKSEELGYKPEMILSGRRVNDSIGQFICDKTIEKMIAQGVNPINAKIAILGLTFKENCSDIRNTKVVSIINSLKSYKCNISIVDDWANFVDADKEYGIKLVDINQIIDFDAVILTVAHQNFSNIKIKKWKSLLKDNGVIIDVKSLYNESFFINTNFNYWRL